MNTMHVLGRRGDSTVTWDPDNAASVDTARQAFDTLRNQGMLAFVPGAGESAKQIKEFDPAAKEIEFVRRIAGG